MCTASELGPDETASTASSTLAVSSSYAAHTRSATAPSGILSATARLANQQNILSLSSLLSLSILKAIFQVDGSADTRMSPFWILLELRMTEVVVTTGAVRRAKFQSNHHHQQTNIQCFTGRMPFLSPSQQCLSTEGEKYHVIWTCSLQAFC